MPHTGSTGKGGQAPPKKHKHPSQHPGGHIPYNPPPSGDPVAVTGTPGHYKTHPVAWIIRRQQILRRAGFNIAVDGVYGPATTRAWSAFLRGISASGVANLHQSQHFAGQAVPPGYVRYNGRIVPKQQATILHAIQGVRQVPSSFDGARARQAGAQAAALNARRLRNQQLEQSISRNPALRALASKHGGRGADLAALADKQHHHIAAMDRRIVQQQAVDQVKTDMKNELDRIIGVDGKMLRLDPEYLVKAAKYGRITAHDIGVLIRNGLLDDTDPGDVKVIQYTVNHELPDHKVKVDGVYGATTNAALERLREKASRVEFDAQVKETKRSLYNSGVAQIASQEVFGKVITPEQMLRVLQVGGPNAEILSKSLAHYYDDWQSRQAVEELQQQRAQAILGTPGDTSHMDHSYVFDLLTRQGASAQDKALAFAHDINEFQGSLREIHFAAVQRALAAKQAQMAADRYFSSPGGKPGFFSEMWDAYYNDTPLDNMVDFTKGAVSAVYQPVQHYFGRAVIFDYDYYTQLTTLNPSGFKSPWQAWQDSEITYSEIHAHNGWKAIVFDLVVDPVNFVPAAWVAKGFELAGKGLLIANSANRLARSIEWVDRYSVRSNALHNAIHVPAYKSHVWLDGLAEGGIRSKLPEAGVSPLQLIKGEAGVARINAAERLKRGTIYAMATTTRAEALRKAHKVMSDVFITTLRDVSFGRISKPLVTDAAAAHHLEKIHAMRGLVPGDLLDAHNMTLLEQSEAFASAAPDTVSALEKIKTPMFRRTAGYSSSDLTAAGIRVNGHLLEQGRQSTILRYRMLKDFEESPSTDLVGLKRLTTSDLDAKHLAEFGLEKNKLAYEEAGTWFEGGLPHEYFEILNYDLGLLRERILKQILPQFDDIILPKLTDAELQVVLRDGEIALASEGTEEAARSLDEFLGYNVDDAYLEKNWVETVNPNYGKAVTWEARTRYSLSEIQRRQNSVDTYAQLKTAIGDESRDWTAWATKRHAEIQADVQAAWNPVPGEHLWEDSRHMIRAPKPTVLEHGVTKTLVQQQTATMIDVFLSFDRAPRTQFLRRIHKKGANDILDRLETGGVPYEDWTKYADSGKRVEALQALVEAEVLPQIYKNEHLLWYGLRESQSRLERMAYFGGVGALGLWKTATLPLRPAFVVRNVADNFSKMMLEGFHDPRLFFAPAQQGIESIFRMADFNALKKASKYIDMLSGGRLSVTERLIEVERKLWDQSPSVLERIMKNEGIPHHPNLFRRSMAEDERSRNFGEIKLPGGSTQGTDVANQVRAITRHDLPKTHYVNRFRDFFWEMAVAKPEGYMSKQLYVSAFRKERARLLAEADPSVIIDDVERKAQEYALNELAKDRASKVVADTLFDYDNVTVLEENLKVLAPFIFFWRSNAQFWGRQVYRKPWFFYEADKVYEAHLESNLDQPAWMRRYVDLSPVAGAMRAAHFGWAADWLASGVSIDPLSYTSISAFYRAFKSGNQDLAPGDTSGWPFIANLVDAFNADAGLSINPFMRFLGERFGVLNYRTWQDIFPQTSLLTALSNIDVIREHLDVGPAGFDIEKWLGDKIFHDMFGGKSTQQMTIENFNYYVQREMAAQQARGETPNRDEAEKKIRGFILFQTLVGYNIGSFPRRMTPDDIAIDKIADYVRQIYTDDSMTADEKRNAYNAFMANQSPDMKAAYKLYQKNKAMTDSHDDYSKHKERYDPAAFDRWAIGARGAQAYYSLEDPADREAFLAQHPEVLPLINELIDDRVPTSHYIKDLTLISDTQAWVDFSQIFLDDIQADYKVKQAVNQVLVTPELKAFWDRNKTPEERRVRHIAGSYFGYISRVNNTYFAIPDNHYAARSEYLSKHPELTDWWARNDTASDDYRAIQLAANSTFREIYFKMVDAGDWDAADIFLKRHSYMFDYTSAEGRITPDGNWLPRSQAQKDYAGVAEDLKTYYSYGGSAAGESYLLGHPNVRRFLTKYKGTAGMQEYAADYDKMKSVNDTYFSLPESQKAAFLAAHPELKAYWNKYAHERSDSQHARDYLAVKSLLDAFFALSDGQKGAYLAAHPTLQAYFDKYGSHQHHASIRTHIAVDPEAKQRYDFWTHYFALPPNKRAQFVYTHAADAGVFIYGSLAGNWRHDIEAEWHRKSLRFGTSDKAAAYMSIKPLMDLYFSLTHDSEKALFLQTNPELQVYFEMFGDPFTKNKKLNKLIEQYFMLPGFSPQRAAFILAHPEIRDYFNAKASPKELAIQRQADAYFSLPYNKRQEYVYRHPELQAYFDQRANEHALFTSLTAAFNETDPRMKEFYEMYSDIIPKDAIHRYFLQVKKMAQLAASRDDTGRVPQPADEVLRRVTRNPA